MAKQVKLIAQTMTEEEQAKAREEQRLLAEAEAEAAANRMAQIRGAYSFDIRSKRQTQIASDYHGIVTGETAPSLEMAIATIAAHFYDPAMIWDRELGKSVQGNAMAYTQKDVLNGICFTLSGRLTRTEDNLDTARAKVKVALQASDGTEISLTEITRALEWADRIEAQRLEVDELLNGFRVAHLIATGQKFVMPAPQHKATASAPAKADAINDLAKRLAAHGMTVDLGVAPSSNPHEEARRQAAALRNRSGEMLNADGIDGRHGELN